MRINPIEYVMESLESLNAIVAFGDFGARDGMDAYDAFDLECHVANAWRELRDYLSKRRFALGY